jgi:phage terminase large subunit
VTATLDRPTRRKSGKVQRHYFSVPEGGPCAAVWKCKEPEVLFAAPAGTGKTRLVLEKLHAMACKYPNMRGLMLRKTQTSLTASALVTYKDEVLVPPCGVKFFGGNKQSPAAFQYPNGSELVVGGMDKADKVLSTQYDVIYVNEANELTEAEWENLSIRCRRGHIPYQQLIADCNPQWPNHWLKVRSDAGRMRRFDGVYQDNLRYWNPEKGDWTADGAAYMARLQNLTGVRRKRLLEGVWAAAEGLVYDAWDPAVHLIDRFPIPDHWPRYRVIDFGFVNPFVCLWLAEDNDGRLFVYRELYHTQRTVAVHAVSINEWSRNEGYVATVADHDAEDRATLAAAGINTLPAYKAVSRGIQAVQERLKLTNGKPRLFVMRDSLIEIDQSLVDSKKPFCTAQEFDSYVWHKNKDGIPDREEPLKEDDHGMDCLRYISAFGLHLDSGLPQRRKVARSYRG